MANPIDIVLGLAGLALGLNSIKNGAKRLHNGLSSSPQTTVKRIPRGMPPMLNQTKHMGTRAGPMRTTLYGVRTLDERMAVISAQAQRGKVDPRVIAWARKTLSKKCRSGWNGEQWCVPEKDTKAEIAAIFGALRRDIRYTSDVRGVDTYAHPKATLGTSAGDCDEYASTGCAALMAVGIPCRYKVIQTKNSQTPDHIYIQGGFPKEAPRQWISLDASVPVKPGWEAPASMVAKSWIYELE